MHKASDFLFITAKYCLLVIFLPASSLEYLEQAPKSTTSNNTESAKIVITQNPKSRAKPYFATERVKTKAIAALINCVKRINLVSVKTTDILANLIIRL